MSKPIAIAADHAGYALKERLKDVLRRRGLAFEDFGASSEASVDYPDFAHKVAEAVASGAAERGLLVCGSGQGMAMAANRHRGVRAALPFDEQSARLARQHNDANVIALGARTLPAETSERLLEVFLDTPFEGGRHERRVSKIDEPAC
jgi:ribose 5-phosphate isomerase B